MKIIISKCLGKICIVLLLCLSLVLSATACGQNENNENKTNSSTNNDTVDDSNTSNDTDVSTDVSNDFFASMEDIQQIPTILSYYNKTDNSVFLKLKISKIHDEVYIDKRDIAIYGASGLVMLECSVVKDLYSSGLDLNQSVVLPVFLNQCFFENDSPVYKDLNIDDVRSFLSQMDHIYVSTRLYTNGTFIVKNDFTTEIHTNLSPCNLSLYELLPSVDGNLSINQLDSFFSEKHIENLPHHEIYGMNSFCPEGITCAMFEDNVKKLSEYFDNKLNK